MIQFINGIMNKHVKTRLLTNEDNKLDEAVKYLEIQKEIRSSVKSAKENETC